MEVPGYEVRRVLARSDAAQVFLATHQPSGGTAALKIVHCEQPDAVARQLHQLRCVARLAHPHIVRTFDVIHCGQYLAIAMEPLLGGDLEARLRKGLSMPEVVQVGKDLAAALHHAHGRGCMHGDVTPANVLFRSGPSPHAVLVDFGIALPPEGRQAHREAGAVRGTRGYMSPEQAAGGALDPRSDLYSLGVVFARMVTGGAPGGANGGPPSVPSRYLPFQGVFDKFMASDPGQRFQTGAEAAAALTALRVDTIVPGRPVRVDVVATSEVEAVAASLEGGNESREEGRSAGRLRRRAGRPIAAVALAAAVFAAGAYAVAQRDAVLPALAALIEDAETADAWQTAEALRRDPNQSLAAIVAAYRRVLERDPGHAGAREGISAVAAAWKVDINEALAAGDVALADAKLMESLNVFSEDADLSALFERVSERRRADSILLGARALLATHSLSHEPSATAAIQAYQEVLRRLPENAEARARLDELAAHYAALAERAVADGDVSDAIAKLGRASAANPSYAAVERVRGFINQAATLQSEIDGMLGQASAYRENGALVDPPEANAAEIYRRVLATDPDNVIAHQRLLEIAAQVAAQFDGLLAAGDLPAALRLVDQATAVGLGDAAVGEMRERHDAEAGRRDAVARLLADAEALFAAGYFTAPVDANAVARLREVNRLDPDNQDATDLLRRTARRLAAVADEAWEAGMQSEARYYLDLALTVTPGVAEWQDRRDEWGEDAAQG